MFSLILLGLLLHPQNPSSETLGMAGLKLTTFGMQAQHVTTYPHVLHKLYKIKLL